MKNIDEMGKDELRSFVKSHSQWAHDAVLAGGDQMDHWLDWAYHYEDAPFMAALVEAGTNFAESIWDKGVRVC